MQEPFVFLLVAIGTVLRVDWTSSESSEAALYDELFLGGNTLFVRRMLLNYEIYNANLR